MEVSPLKTTLTTFQRSYAHGHPDFQLLLKGKPLPYAPNPKILGIRLSEDNSFHAHAEMISERARKRLQGLKVFAGRNDSKSEDLRIFYRAFVESVLLYGLPAYFPRLSDGDIAGLESIVYEGALVITGMDKGVSREAVIREAGIETLTFQVKLESAALYAKALSRLDIDPLRRVAAELLPGWPVIGANSISGTAMSDSRVRGEVSSSAAPLPNIGSLYRSGFLKFSVESLDC